MAFQQDWRDSVRTGGSSNHSSPTRWSETQPFNERLQQQQQQQQVVPARQQQQQNSVIDLEPSSMSKSRRRRRKQVEARDVDSYSDSVAFASGEDSKKRNPFVNKALRFSLLLLKFIGIFILVNLLIFLWPIDGPQIEAQVAPERPMPSYSGALASNDLLDKAELLFAGQFHAPESMAWTADKRTFYTGVEGGFILRVEAYEERWTLVARLNARHSVRDLSHKVTYNESTAAAAAGSWPTSEEEDEVAGEQWAPFCTRDVELYGKRAEFEPRLVALSRCSRPLGIRLSPDASYLYASDPLSGIFRVDLSPTAGGSTKMGQVTKLADFTTFQSKAHLSIERQAAERVLFADDIAVIWAAKQADQTSEEGDLIYLTDCSRKYTLRYLLPMMIEYDDSGRVLEFDTRRQRFRTLKLGGDGANQLLPPRLSFPNGLELSANQSALLISDLNNRRLLLHHLRGPHKGETNHLLWLPGYPDNVRRGLDTADGRATYWLACGCSRAQSKLEPTESFNNYPLFRYQALKTVRLLGNFLELLGSNWLLGNTTWLLDSGTVVKTIWLRNDLICAQSFVLQLDESGQVLRSLHAPHFLSPFKLLSEAHEVPLLEQPGGANLSSHYHSALYLGSVYYPYLGRAYLPKLEVVANK